MTYTPSILTTGIFGEQITSSLTPEVQFSNQYAIDPANSENLETFSATGGSVDANGNLLRCQSGTSVGGYGVIRSKRAVTYRAGQGIMGRFTAKFTTGVATSLQLAGFFSLTETLAFGYDGADFSIIHEYDGAAELQTIEITTGATTGANCTVTLDSDAVVIALTNSTAQTNAAEIRDALEADATTGGKWRFEQVDDTVYCIAKAVGNKTGTMSYAAGTTGSAATVTEVTAGVAKSSGNIAQADWDNPTPFAGFDPTMLNVYKIEYGYLGATGPRLSVYNPAGDFVVVHQIQWANNNSTPVFGSPSMQIGWTAASLGSSGTNLTVEGSSAMAAVEGVELIRNGSKSQNNSVSAVATTLTNIITIKNRIVRGGRFNLGQIMPANMSFDNDHNKGVIIELRRNATIGGTQNFQFEDENNSLALYDTAGTTVTGGDLIVNFILPKDSGNSVDLTRFEITLTPEDQLTAAAKTVSGTSTSVTGGITWLEKK